MDTPDQSSAILSAYIAIFRALQGATLADWLDLDCSLAQLKALFVIARAEPVAIGRVAETLQIGLPTASHLVDRLVQDGLVVRVSDPADRRRALASLTAEGAQRGARVREGSAVRLHSWIDQLDDEQRAALACGLQALARVAQPDLSGPAEAQREG
ncbi:MAG: MarR family transcriptional regulator [Chloroflexales bacterium]|nr:MarR family transcriptional regulator [Chloroflexales bacterium]